MLALAVISSLLVVQPAAAVTAGTPFGWGRNGNGEVGDNTTVNRSTPVAISTAQTFAEISGGFFHTIGLTSTGNVYGWGTNSSNQVGVGTTSDEYHTPVLVTALPANSISQISAYGDQSLALQNDGTIWQ
ncbi:MAG: cell wall anchor protein, partial [Actinobacteria bacterium]|nr:cell wall anchor protein [Actinomycetota bacterium]